MRLSEGPWSARDEHDREWLAGFATLRESGRRVKLLILALVLCLPMLGCAGAKQLDPTSTVSGASTETEGNDWSGETPSQTLPNDGTASRTIEFDFTSEEGWHYSGSLPWPEQTIALEKDISQSPPGSARLRIAVSGDSAEPSTFANDNPGRNGPDLTISARRVCVRDSCGNSIRRSSRHTMPGEWQRHLQLRTVRPRNRLLAGRRRRWVS